MVSDPVAAAPLILSFDNGDIQTAFNLATFGPQPLWALLILFPNWEGTKRLMGSWYPLLFFWFVHLFIVVVSPGQDIGTAPIDEFNAVFDPSGDPQKAMMNMMTYPNFVSEEWSHVLFWDLFVGRYIWLDGIRRDVFTGHSVLLCNLIGPPGILLHFLTCTALGKGLPPDAQEEGIVD